MLYSHYTSITMFFDHVMSWPFPIIMKHKGLVILKIFAMISNEKMESG